LIAICGKEKACSDLESVFAAQMQSAFFPVPLYKMGSKIAFWQPDISRYTGPLGNTSKFLKHNHPGGAYSYRLTEKDKTFVYCTDIEHGDEIDQRVVELSRGADLLIHDAQYTPDELKQKKGWGHSSWEQAVEVAERAGVKKPALFHHDPEHYDDFILNMEKQCQKRFPNAFFAREGSNIEF
jgi:ribonuclease BN (tRNA processing enzyme)